MAFEKKLYIIIPIIKSINPKIENIISGKTLYIIIPIIKSINPKIENIISGNE